MTEKAAPTRNEAHRASTPTFGTSRRRRRQPESLCLVLATYPVHGVASLADEHRGYPALSYARARPSVAGKGAAGAPLGHRAGWRPSTDSDQAEACGAGILGLACFSARTDAYRLDSKLAYDVPSEHAPAVVSLQPDCRHQHQGTPAKSNLVTPPVGHRGPVQASPTSHAAATSSQPQFGSP